MRNPGYAAHPAIMLYLDSPPCSGARPRSLLLHSLPGAALYFFMLLRFWYCSRLGSHGSYSIWPAERRWSRCTLWHGAALVHPPAAADSCSVWFSRVGAARSRTSPTGNLGVAPQRLHRSQPSDWGIDRRAAGTVAC